MKHTFVLPLTFLFSSFLLPSCEKVQDAKAAGESAVEAVGNLDADSMKNKVGDLVAKLGDIKDLASAEAISEKVGPILDVLAKGKNMLAGKLDESSITEAITSLTTRFAGQADIMETLAPLIERLTALVK
jgi:hypothetical protein